MNRTTKIMGVALLAAGLAAANAPAGQADPSTSAPYRLVDSCPGSPVEGFPKALKNNLGDTAGSLNLWYSSVNGGTNCVKVYDNDGDEVTRHQMSVTLRREDLSYRGEDSGRYKIYAGGVLVPDADNRCVYVTGSVTFGAGQTNRYTGAWGPVACG